VHHHRGFLILPGTKKNTQKLNINGLRYVIYVISNKLNTDFFLFPLLEDSFSSFAVILDFFVTER
jgi:hypothetical protein